MKRSIFERTRDADASVHSAGCDQTKSSSNSPRCNFPVKKVRDDAFCCEMSQFNRMMTPDRTSGIVVAPP